MKPCRYLPASHGQAMRARSLPVKGPEKTAASVATTAERFLCDCRLFESCLPSGSHPLARRRIQRHSRSRRDLLSIWLAGLCEADSRAQSPCSRVFRLPRLPLGNCDGVNRSLLPHGLERAMRPCHRTPACSRWLVSTASSNRWQPLTELPSRGSPSNRRKIAFISTSGRPPGPGARLFP